MADPKVTYRVGVDDEATRVLRGIDGQISGLMKSFRTLGGFAGFAAVTASISGMVAGVIELAGELQDASQKLGVSAVALQKLKGAAEQTGASFETIQTSLVFLAKTTGAATKGSKEAAESFRLLGIDANKLAQIPLDRRLAVIASQLQQIPDAGTRAELAVRVLGRSAADLLPLLGNLDEELGKVNTTLTDEQVAALDAAGDAWESFKRNSLTGTGIVLGSLLLKFREVGEAAGQLFANGAMPGAIPVTPGAPASKGPSSRNRGVSLSAEEAAAIVGAPGRKSLDEAKAILTKAFAEFDDLMAKQEASTHHTSLQGTESLQLLADSAADWNAELEKQGQILADIEPPIETYRKAIEDIRRLNSEGLLTDDQAIAAQKKALEDLSATAQDAGQRVQSDTDKILNSIKNATEGFARDITDVFFGATNDIGQMFADLAEQIAKMFFQQAVVQPWLDALGGLFGSMGGPKEIDLSKLPTRRALGGPVAAGAPYFVGENGPELFVPRMAGSIIPNGQAAAMGGPTINFNISTPDPRAAAQVIAANERVIVGIVNRAMRRGGRPPELR